jgi:hypothetical protein
VPVYERIKNRPSRFSFSIITIKGYSGADCPAANVADNEQNITINLRINSKFFLQKYAVFLTFANFIDILIPAVISFSHF